MGGGRCASHLIPNRSPSALGRHPTANPRAVGRTVTPDELRRELEDLAATTDPDLLGLDVDLDLTAVISKAIPGNRPIRIADDEDLAASDSEPPAASQAPR
jgi:hypothetical protein